jgi:hypothetical protein
LGKSKTTNVTNQITNQQRDPYAAAVPGLQSAGAGITSWMNNPANAQAYQGQRVAGMSGRTQAGLDEMYNSGGLRQTQDYLSGVLGGNYLGQSNPHLAQLQDSIKASVMPSINSRVSASGMAPGSSVDQSLVGREMTRAMAQPLFQTYENERGRQMQAAGMMPGVSQGIIGNMVGAGQMGEAYQQRDLDAARQTWEENRMAGLRPYAEATPLLATIGNMGGTSSGTTTGTQTQSTSPSWGQTALGAGMMGASLFTPGGIFGGARGLFGGDPMPGGGGLTAGMKQVMNAQGIPLQPGMMGPMVPGSQFY